jgi:hypothetical protein
VPEGVEHQRPARPPHIAQKLACRTEIFKGGLDASGKFTVIATADVE